MFAHAPLLLAAAAASAEPPQGPEIVVTAPGGADGVALRDAPGNVQVIGVDAGGQHRDSNLADLLDGALGSVSLSNGSGSPYQSDVAYRGFQATSLLGAPTGLSVWLDGVRMNEPFGAIVNWDLIPMVAIRAVTVMPGANPLFGLNTLGGALVLRSRDGADDPGLTVTARGGSFARRGGEARAGGTIAGRTIDWFVAANHDAEDGYRWYTHTRVDQAYGKLRWHDAQSRAEIDAIWADTALAGTQALPLSMLAMPKSAYTWPDSVANTQIVVNLKGETRIAATLQLSANLYYRRSASKSANSNAALGANCDGATYDCGNLAPGGTALDLYAANPFLTGTPSAAGFTPYAGPLPIHDFTSGINTTLVLADLAQHVFGGNALVDFDGELGGLAHDFNFGGSFETARIAFGQTTALARLADYRAVPMPVNALYGSAAGFAGDPQVNAVALGASSTGFDVFVRDVVRIDPHLSLTAALAFTATHVRLDGTQTTALDPGGAYVWTASDGTIWYNPAYLGAQYWDAARGTLVTATAPSGALAGPEVDPVAGRHGWHRINPSLGLAWNPRADLGLFANYSEAMRAPTAIELACADPARPCALPTGFNGDPDLKAVVAHAVELGARGAIGGRWRWNAALFSTRLDNDIQFIYQPSGLGAFANLGHTARKGFELGLSAQFAKAAFAASYGQVAATYRDSFVDANGDRVAPGSQIPGVPRQAFKLSGSWQPLRALALGAGLRAVSRQYAHGDEANRQPAVPGYALVDLDVHLYPAARVELYARVTNLFDVRYATFGVLGSNVYTGADEQFRTPAPGRAVVGGVRYGFGG